MDRNMYSIRDAKVGFANPFVADNNAVALRQFEALASDGSSMVARFPMDFALYHVGSFDSDSGEFTPLMPVQLCNATDFMKGE